MIQVPLSSNQPNALTAAADLFGSTESPAVAGNEAKSPAVAQPQPPSQSDGLEEAEIVDPFGGEVVSVTDIDGLIDLYEKMKRISDQAYAVLQLVRRAAGNLAKGNTKTRRLQGDRRKAVIEMPGDSWDQSKLREAWHSYPHLREQCLRIDSIGVRLTEYKKLVNTTGTPDVETFKSMVKDANRGPTGLPTIKIEK